jgi:dTDP-4-amino-4,6-dideoxygalactose transaminase
MISIDCLAIGEREKRRVIDVLDRGTIAGGTEVRSFENEFADFCDVDHGIATVNGTAALYAALDAIGIGKGDRVLTTPFSFIATADAIRFCGAEPVFADVDPETYNLDPERTAQQIADTDVDAILAVHLYGLPANMTALRRLADEHDVPLLEDAAQAHGARYEKAPVGSLGDVACFSFSTTVNMTTGEGGIIVTDSPSIADHVAEFIDHGRSEAGSHAHSRVGHNFRMTDLAAAIGRVQLERLPKFIEIRRSVANQLTETITAEVSTINAPSTPDDRTHAYHQYPIRTDERAALIDHLASYGVDSGVYYPRTIPSQPPYHCHDEPVPVAESLAETVLCLPVHPGLSTDDVRQIEAALIDYTGA